MDTSLYKTKLIHVRTMAYKVRRRKSNDFPIPDTSLDVVSSNEVGQNYDGLISISREDDGVYQWKLKINSGIVGRVVGAKFKNFAMIERDTGATIKTESIRKGLQVVINGDRDEVVRSAAMRILAKVSSVRTIGFTTHFIAITLATLKDKLEKFSDDVPKRFSFCIGS
ncbi:hypothetical protein ACOME3_001567 [Neoechinorhynchus agilis]